jgi:ABC-type phosphate/phosphonate transport system substrate-binding protein
MYDWPEVSSRWNSLWKLVRAELSSRGIDAAETLARVADHEAQWTDPDLVIGQTCGWPFVSALKESVVPFARFDFGLGGRPGDYHSVFITNDDASPHELLGDPAATIAINAYNSQSGFRALSELAGHPARLSASRFLVTGGHRNSIREVAAGRAQLAAIDAQSWKLALAHEPAAAQVKIASRSSDVPGLPLITAPAFAAITGDLFAAMDAALDQLSGEDRAALGAGALVPARAEDYAVLTQPPFGRLDPLP